MGMDGSGVMSDDRGSGYPFNLLRMDEHLLVEICWNLAGEIDGVVNDFAGSQGFEVRLWSGVKSAEFDPSERLQYSRWAV